MGALDACLEGSKGMKVLCTVYIKEPCTAVQGFLQYR